MNDLVEIGTPPWTRSQMQAQLKEFAQLYDRRPIRDNTGGMKAPHMFLAWFVLQKLQPKAIVESGVWYGQGTWLFEQACPSANLYCIDPDLDRIRYRSPRATYLNSDFITHNWNHLPKEETLLFFDDHQNAYERTKIAKWFGFKHAIFEDNYPPGRGDFYTLKKVLARSGFQSMPDPSQISVQAKLIRKLKKALRLPTWEYYQIPPNDLDAAYLKSNLEIYHELPPVYKSQVTRWGDPWDDRKYPTPSPLLETIDAENLKIYAEEAPFYFWMCYVKLY